MTTSLVNVTRIDDSIHLSLLILFAFLRGRMPTLDQEAIQELCLRRLHKEGYPRTAEAFEKFGRDFYNSLSWQGKVHGVFTVWELIDRIKSNRILEFMAESDELKEMFRAVVDDYAKVRAAESTRKAEATTEFRTLRRSKFGVLNKNYKQKYDDTRSRGDFGTLRRAVDVEGESELSKSPDGDLTTWKFPLFLSRTGTNYDDKRSRGDFTGVLSTFRRAVDVEGESELSKSSDGDSMGWRTWKFPQFPSRPATKNNDETSGENLTSALVAVVESESELDKLKEQLAEKQSKILQLENRNKRLAWKLKIKDSKCEQLKKEKRSLEKKNRALEETVRARDQGPRIS